MSPLADLAGQLSGRLLTAADPGFADALAGYNTAVTHTPEAVVVAADEADVVATLRAATAAGMRVHVRSTGHGDRSPVADGIVLRVEAFDDVAVDAGAGTATFGGGTRWAAIVAAAAPHGLAPIPGSSATVGAVGYLLGGGLGPFARSHGVSSDYLRSLRVVTGAGEVVTASAEEHPDLFWALRGGKGGLGVVLSATIDLVPMPELYAGALFFDIAVAAEVLDGWTAWARTADPRVTTSVLVARFPGFDAVPPPLRGRHLIALRFAFAGPAAEGEALAAPLRALAPVHLDGVGPMPIADVARIHSDPTEPGPARGGGFALGPLDADFTAAFVGLFGAGTELPFVAAEIRQLGGRIAADAAVPSAVGARDAAHVVHLVGIPDLAVPTAAITGAMAAVRTALAAWITPATPINWVEDAFDATAIGASWPAATRERLAEVRRRYDPAGVFALGPVAL